MTSILFVSSHRFEKCLLCDFLRIVLIFYQCHQKRIHVHVIGVVQLLKVCLHVSPPLSAWLYQLDGVTQVSLQEIYKK